MNDDTDQKRRACYLSVQELYNLNVNCAPLAKLYGYGVYLVGSVLTRANYRDVDVRCILADEEFDRMFGTDEELVAKRTRFLGVAISEWLSNRTSLPVDFQFQRQTEANKEFDGTRSALGVAP